MDKWGGCFGTTNGGGWFEPRMDTNAWVGLNHEWTRMRGRFEPRMDTNAWVGLNHEWTRMR
ncbi:MAG: hypothetical protein ACK5YO_15250, partial [Planctomyces sp.]